MEWFKRILCALPIAAPCVLLIGSCLCLRLCDCFNPAFGCQITINVIKTCWNCCADKTWSRSVVSATVVTGDPLRRPSPRRTSGHAVARRYTGSDLWSQLTHSAWTHPRGTARDLMTSSDDGQPIACRLVLPSNSAV